jgi:DNA repair protein RadC
MVALVEGRVRTIRDRGDDWESLLGEQTQTEPISMRTADASDLARFRARRELGRRYLPFLKTLVDFDIASEIGLHELTGPPLTVKQLLLLDLAPSVTVLRRLDRLCNLGVISRTRSLSDGRVNELRLAPAVHQLFAIYANQMPGSAVAKNN